MLAACRAGLYKQLSELKSMLAEVRDDAAAVNALKEPIAANLEATGVCCMLWRILALLSVRFSDLTWTQQCSGVIQLCMLPLPEVGVGVDTDAALCRPGQGLPVPAGSSWAG